MATCITAAAVAIAEPVALTAMFYLLPMTLAAYFLDRRAVAANLALVAAGYGLALALWVGPVLGVASFVAVLAIVMVVSSVVLALTERVGGLMRRLEQLATFDALTGALTRQALTDRLEAELARVARTGATSAVAMIDIDHFKALNDARGHAAVAAVFGDLLRERLAVAGSPVTVSVGVADTSGSGPSADAILADADDALYTAKRAGRDRVSRAARRGPVRAVA